MVDNLADLPIGEADRLARGQIEHHRQEMARWRRARAVRVAKEREERSVAEIAADMGIHQQVVYDLLREAKSS